MSLRRAHCPGGFTLLETLVALAILAITLTAAFRAIGMASGQASELRDRLLAEWVAQDRLAEHRALRQWLDTGSAEGVVEEGGRSFRYQEEIKATPNPLFRRMDVKVFAAGSDSQLAHMTGFLTRAAQ
ncbi:MAG TPA: type II secretion system minor pseudopilin GspI [Rhodocyclaceae bacterium]|nr:type II secretion system minor pseudopilin GspI [Rhodocyclaceae bacterium]